MSKEPKENGVSGQVKADPKVTGMPPTPENLTPLGAPVDERFANPQPYEPPAPPQPAQPPKEEEPASKRSRKSEEDDDENGPKGSKKRR